MTESMCLSHGEHFIHSSATRHPGLRLHSQLKLPHNSSSLGISCTCSWCPSRHLLIVGGATLNNRPFIRVFSQLHVSLLFLWASIFPFSTAYSYVSQANWFVSTFFTYTSMMIYSFWYPGDSSDFGRFWMALIRLRTWLGVWPIIIRRWDFGEVGIGVIICGSFGEHSYSYCHSLECRSLFLPRLRIFMLPRAGLRDSNHGGFTYLGTISKTGMIICPKRSGCEGEGWKTIVARPHQTIPLLFFLESVYFGYLADSIFVLPVWCID